MSVLTLVLLVVASSPSHTSLPPFICSFIPSRSIIIFGPIIDTNYFKYQSFCFVLCNVQGDHVTFLNVYKGFLKCNKSPTWCHKNFVNYQAMVSVFLEVYFVVLCKIIRLFTDWSWLFYVIHFCQNISIWNLSLFINIKKQLM